MSKPLVRTGEPCVYLRGDVFYYTYRDYQDRQKWGTAPTLEEAVVGREKGAGRVTPPAEKAPPKRRGYRPLDAGRNHRDVLRIQARQWAALVPLPYVYFVVAPHAGSVKIGRTADLPKRMDSIQMHSPELLTIACVLHDDGGLENEMHARFRRLRRVGEWFAMTPELIGEMYAMAADGVADDHAGHSFRRSHLASEEAA